MAVRPDAPKSPASKDACSPETSARHGAEVQDICPERQDSAVRPDAHRRKVLNGKNLGEDIQLCGATTEKIVGSSPIDTRHIPSASLDKIKETAEKKGDRQLPANTEVVTMIGSDWDKMFSEIRELLAKERKQSDESERFIINTGQNELTLKNKRIAELEAVVKDLEDGNEEFRGQIAELEARNAELEAEQKEWEAAFAKDGRQAAADLQEHIVVGHIKDAYRLVSSIEKQARSQGRNEAIAEIEKWNEEHMIGENAQYHEGDLVVECRFLRQKLASMKKEVGKNET